MKVFNHRTCFMAGSVLTLAISSLIHAQQPTNLEPVLRELGIMRNIFAGALEQGSRTNKFFGGGPAPDALYLAGQGMVFSFNLPAGNFPFDFGGFCAGNDCNNFNFTFNDENFNINVDPLPGASFEDQLRETQRAVEEQLRDKEEELRDKGEELRERNDELRELNRQMRELGREQRDDPDDAGIAAQMEDLEARVNALQQSVDQEGAAYRETVRQMQDERTAAINAQRQQQIDQVLGVLCDYGSTLKALPGSENVSLVFKNFTGNADQIIVMSHADVSSCTSIDNLKQAAVSYQQ